MLLKTFYDETLAQASYLVGCAASGEALVIDPMRDVTPYLEAAAREGLRITHVAETHIHADFVSGSRELSVATGAMRFLSDMGDAAWKYADADAPNVIPVRDGDMFMVGRVRVQVMHTPGHTPEHVSFAITDTAAADRPIGIFTGDFLFVGDVGRPDLLEEAAGMIGTAEPGARQQYATVEKFKALPDYLQIWPAHGAGSACGKALGAIPSTTLGYEKLFNPAFQFGDEEAFVRWLLDGQPEAPRYFAEMKRVNKVGPALLGDLPTPRRMSRAEIDAFIADGGMVLDLRAAADFSAAHVPGTISIPATERSFSTYAGWFVDYSAPLVLIVPAQDDLPGLMRALRAIGIDRIAGWADGEAAAEHAATLPSMTAAELAERLPQNGMIVLDVRGRSEYCQEHVRGARHIMVGLLPKRLDEIPRDRLIVTQCASGYRSHIAASLLAARGFEQVVNLTDGKETWSKALATAACAAD